MPETFNIWWQLGTAVLTAGAVYGGIRSDIKAIHEQIKQAQRDADVAHKRIDSILMERIK